MDVHNELNQYLEGCPDPDEVWPRWLVKKSSRLLWKCRKALNSAQAEKKMLNRYIEEYQQTNHYVLDDLEALATDIDEMRINRGQKDFLKGRLEEIYIMINEIDGEEDD